MLKIVLFPYLLGAGCIVAGLYGCLHNQISYTVAPDYFHAFKFEQFAISESFHNRLGAALVGWRASWWMGLFIGVPVLLVGLIMPDARQYVVNGLTAMAVVAATTLLVGLAALAYVSLTTSATPFERAGFMHNFSYLGGFCGILTGAAYFVVARIRMGKSAAPGIKQESPAS